MSPGDNPTLSIDKIAESLQASVIVGEDLQDTIISGIYASDLMSDVLAYGKTGAALLTGLNTIQAAISSYMAEFKAIIFLRGKIPTEDIRKFATEKGLIIMTTKADMYEACIRIANINGSIQPSGSASLASKEDKNITSHNFHIEGKDFASAGMVSTQVKSILKTIGYDPTLIRRVAISTYESEMNVVMHAVRAEVTLCASDQEIIVTIADEGKGIPDVEKAMQEGFSTATEEQRALGFGSGMGLPNIKRNADFLKVDSDVGRGTKVEMKFIVKVGAA
jgi:anti-sigma regulatory factor (Ser/Thr protein kinase)